MILDVAPILTQVDCDAIRSGRFNNAGRVGWIGLVGATRLPDRRDVIHIDIETERSH